MGCSRDGDERHKCTKMCFEECEPCQVEVQKKRTRCTHRYKVACSVDVDEIQCEKPCVRDMACGHRCQRKCYEPCGVCLFKVIMMMVFV